MILEAHLEHEPGSVKVLSRLLVLGALAGLLGQPEFQVGLGKRSTAAGTRPAVQLSFKFRRARRRRPGPGDLPVDSESPAGHGISESAIFTGSVPFSTSANTPPLIILSSSANKLLIIPNIPNYS